jgi:tryptophan halogenase
VVQYFPTRAFDPLPIERFNRASQEEWEQVRDFIILHYCANERTDSDFWKYCSSMELPDLLREKIQIFRSSGRFAFSHQELFQKPSWLAVFIGQFIKPEGYHPLADFHTKVDGGAHIDRIARWCDMAAEKMPKHGEFIERTCKSPFATISAAGGKQLKAVRA